MSAVLKRSAVLKSSCSSWASVRRRDFLSLLVFAVLVSAFAACGGATTPASKVQVPGPIARLRAEAAKHPEDASIQARLVEAELLWDGGDSELFDPALARALSLSPGDPLLHFFGALVKEQHGAIAEALGGYLRAIELSRTSDDPLAPTIAEVAIDRLPEPGLVEGYDAKVYPILQKVFEEPGRLGLPARDSAAQRLIGKARRDGKPSEVSQLASKLGCQGDWRAAGPFGPYTWLRFDAGVEAEGKGELAEKYDLGAGRGEKKSWKPKLEACSVQLHGAPVDDGGVTVLETTLEASKEGDYLLMLDLPATARVSVDGERVGMNDRRQRWQASYVYLPLRLTKGEHELEIAIASPTPLREMSVVLEPADSSRGYDPRRGVAAPEGEGAANAFLRALVLEGRGNPVDALEALNALDGSQATTTALMHRASILSDHPFIPHEQKQELFRRIFKRAAKRDPKAYLPELLVARTEQGDREGFEALKRTAERFPHVVDVQLQYASELEEKGQHSQALTIIEKLRAKLPRSCSVLETYAEILRESQRIEQANALVDEAIRCDQRSTDRFALYMRQQRWDKAKEEVERLAPLVSKSHARNLREVWARAVGEDDIVRAIEDEELAEGNNLASRAMLDADRALAASRKSEAARALEKAMASEPRATHGLRRVHRALTGKSDLEPYRIDGLKAIADFKASKRDYDGYGRVLVLDYMAIRVYEDGSSLSLIHQIFKVQSEEALEELGQLSLGGQLLTVRSIKPDGRLLEPEEIEGLDSIPVTDLAVGDFVEYEYTVPRSSSPTGGFDSGGWVFQSYDEPFDLSQITVILPASMNLVVDAQGPVPKPVVKSHGTLKQLTWTMERSLPLEREPAAVPHPPFIPSLHLGVGMTWASHIDSIRDHDAAGVPADPYTERLVREIVGDGKLSMDAKIERIHQWVRSNIDPAGNDGVPTMIRARRGNPFPIYRHLLRLAGIETKLVFVRELGSPDPTDLAQGEVYSNVVLMVEGKTPRFLWFGSRHAPPSFLPAELRGQEGLVIDEGRQKVRLPAGSPEQDRFEVDVDVSLQSDRSGIIDVVETHHGVRGVMWRTQLESVPAADLQRIFAQQYVPNVLPGAELLDMAIEGQEDLDRPLVLRYSVKVKSMGRPSGSDRMLAPFFPTPLHRMYAELPTRKTTRLVDGAQTRVRVRLQGAGAPKRPSNETIKGPQGALYTRTARAEGQSLVVERSISVPPMLVPVDDYPALVQFCHRAAVVEAEELAVAQP